MYPGAMAAGDQGDSERPREQARKGEGWGFARKLGGQFAGEPGRRLVKLERAWENENLSTASAGPADVVSDLCPDCSEEQRE